MDVTIAGLTGTAPVKCSRNVIVTPDVSLESVKDKQFDAVICPGGMGGSESMAAVSTQRGKEIPIPYRQPYRTEIL